MSSPIRLGTRGSVLALAQTRWVGGRLADALGREVEVVEITTQGDRDTQPLAQLGGTGVFVSALREALLDGRIDVAVHSLKDLPTEPAEGIALAAVPTREDPRDAVVARDEMTLGELPVGSRVGTGSPRRAAQLSALGLGLEITDIRGNVDTRIRKVREGAYDAVVLARAGLARMGRLDEATEVLDPLQMLPAPGQGALAVETREGDDLTREATVLDDPQARAAVTAERAVLATLEGGCAAPIGVLAEVVEGDDGEELWVRAVALSPDGTLAVRMSATGAPADAAGVGHRLAEQMLDEGAGQLTETPHEQPVTDCERQDA
jgi:hydroxymethylbilane synthase